MYPLITSPLAGFVIGVTLMTLIVMFFAHAHASRAGKNFRAMQMLSSAIMPFAHGSNNAQKSMGIIAMAAHPAAKDQVPARVKRACASAMAAGTSVGGWRIIKTMGQKIIRLEPVDGIATGVSATQLDIGKCQIKLNRFNEARVILREALETFEELGDPKDIADTLNALAEACIGLNQPEPAAAYRLRAKRAMESSGGD